MPDQTEVDKTVAALSCNPAEVINALQVWENNVIIRHILSARIAERIENKRTLLESIDTIVDLKKAQGDIEGMRASLALVRKTAE